jgi:hypothetical protein
MRTERLRPAPSSSECCRMPRSSARRSSRSALVGCRGFPPALPLRMTDLGPSVGYIFASLALLFAAAGSTWSVDCWLRPRVGAFAWLAAPAVEARGA